MIKTCSNEALDRAFVKLNMYYFATEDKVMKSIMYDQLQMLAKEATKRDNSLYFKFKQFFYSLKVRDKMIEESNKIMNDSSRGFDNV